MKVVILTVLGLLALALIIFPEFRKKLVVLIRGGLNLFVEDRAKTPEGAEAVFTQAINEVEDQYTKASTTYNKLYGKLQRCQEDVVKLNNEIKKAENSCESLAKNGDVENARIYAERRMELITERDQKNEAITKLIPMVEEAKQIHEAYGKKLRELKRNKKETVAQMKMNVQMKDLLGDLDELRKDSATSKMLDVVIEGSNDLQEEVNGARAVHENRASTKIARAEQKAAQAQSDAYLDNLLKKYNGGK
jgi:phage shock protein A